MSLGVTEVSGRAERASGFEQTLAHLRSKAGTGAGSAARKGRLFERLMRQFFLEDPLYQDRFARVWLWSEWAAEQADFDGRDTGIDLVAAERTGGFCAIQCKCYARGTRIQKSHLDSFISASAREPFTARVFVDTGADWGANAKTAIRGLKPRCEVLRYGDLASSPLYWPDLRAGESPEKLKWEGKPFRLRDHQREALDKVVKGFRKHDRGKMIMACGTGKTFTALKIAERVAGAGGRVLFLVPSISLLQQAMREWAEQKSIGHRYIGICSDTRAGRSDEDAILEELEIPVTTDSAEISKALRTRRDDTMTVVFSTYHSLPLVETAQDAGAPPFDLILCDEAHRTTGIERPKKSDRDKTSPFVLVHNAERIRANKRLYMTATPRLYTEGAKKKAVSHNVEVFSMDNRDTYGPEFYRLPFSQAVRQDLLSDYKVVILAISEEHVAPALQAHLARGGSEINLTDAAKIVGCWRALQDPEDKRGKNGQNGRGPLGRAIAFTNVILSSKRLEKHWNDVIEQAVSAMSEPDREKYRNAFRCEVKHVDGQHNALDRKGRIEWLKGLGDGGGDDRSSGDGVCRILSNARCLSEGIDVPALDAVLFMSPRRSQVDIVQAVGRVMRKAPNKTYGYIILPIAVPAGADPTVALEDHKGFDVVWDVLRALRSHDDRFNAEINQIDLNRKKNERIIIVGDKDERERGESGQIPISFGPMELPAGAIYAKIVEKCGDRKYWESWAEDVADIFSRLVTRIEGLLDNRDNEALGEWFDAFLAELKASINEGITRDDAIEMMAQHIITQPVFNALFEHYRFSTSNPVAKALDSLRDDFGEFGLANETRDLEGFYDSVAMRAKGLDNSDARQRVLMELYEKFFAKAMKKDAERLGIVYTPVEIVDFILHSADHVMRAEFGRGLTDEGVHVLDAFAGTGIFLGRLLQSELIRSADLERKFRSELHANEIVLLAYYIAAVHIEEAFHGRRKTGGGYEPFKGILLTDTFNLNVGRPGFLADWLEANSARAERQQKLPIQVIVGNPPWSAGQRSSADNNPNVPYPELAQRVAETYAARSRSTNKTSLYDSYKMAIRWASDRIGKQGIVAFVTNGSWIDGNVDSGVRACLNEEFSSIRVLNLRGNARTSGDRRKAEGGGVFGHGSRAPVAITILIRNPDAMRKGCSILYRDIGDYLKRRKKLAILGETRSIAGVGDWKEIVPDSHHDWVGQRDPAFQTFFPLGTHATKAGKANDAIFRLFSNGYKTGRDAYIYNFTREACATNALSMVREYRAALQEWKEKQHLTVEDITPRYSRSTRWDRELKNNLRRGVPIRYSANRIWITQYRPFVKQHCYAEYALAQTKGMQDRLFPYKSVARFLQKEGRKEGRKNLAIGIPTIGDTKPFSCLIVNALPDLNVMTGSQWFPRYRYIARTGSSAYLAAARRSRSRSSLRTECPTSTSSSSASASPAGPIHKVRRPPSIQGGIFDDPELFQTDVERVDNITDTALAAFRNHYTDPGITKDDIFDYVYGLLHAPEYGKRFASDLSKGLPRIPFATDFAAFAQAGRELAALHLGYETCEEAPLTCVFNGEGEPRADHYRLGTKKMKLSKDGSVLVINEHIRVEGIPPEAHRYEVNGRSPLGWFIDRYHIKTDKHSGIVNDPNGWFEDPRDLITAIRRVVHVSIETVRIVGELPDPFA